MHLLLILIDNRQIDGVLVIYLLLTLREGLVIVIDDGLGFTSGDHADHPDKSSTSYDSEEDIESVSREWYYISHSRYRAYDCNYLQVDLPGLAGLGKHSQGDKHQGCNLGLQ